MQARALVSKLADTVQNQIHNFLSNSVMSTSVVVGGILLSRDELLGMEKLAIGSSPDFINYSGLQINEDSTRNVLSGTSLSKEGGEGIISTHELVGGHLAIRLDPMLKAVELPTGIANLATSLTNVDGDTLTLNKKNYKKLAQTLCGRCIISHYILPLVQAPTVYSTLLYRYISTPHSTVVFA